jgi:hypothetical protein
MTRLIHTALAAALVLGLCATVAAQSGYVPPIRGEAEIGVLPPVTKVDFKAAMVITTIKVKNLSTTGSIAGLKVEEFWYDKSGNPVTGSRDRLKKPLMPGEIATFTLQTPRDPRMARNSYVFSHVNGKIKTKPMKSF